VYEPPGCAGLPPQVKMPFELAMPPEQGNAKLVDM
jgi:hypothetical protein